MNCDQLPERQVWRPRKHRAMSVSRRTVRQVAVLIDDADSYARDVLAGIGRYLQESDPRWALHVIGRNRFEMPPPFLRSWKGDGIIARVDSVAVEAELLTLNLPVVSVSGALKEPQFPTVVQDSQRTAKLAFEWFRDRKHRNFGFVGYESLEWSIQRASIFQELLAASGVELQQLLLREDSAFGLEAEKTIADWLSSMSYPVAVWAANDEIGIKVLNACLAVGLSVPGQVSVLGADNDASIAQWCATPLSSIKLNGRGAGYEAAQLLARWMSGEVPPPGQWKAFAPTGIASRASTDAYVIDDPHVKLALSIIHEDACKGVSVAEVASRIPLSRGQLERKFKTVLNRTPFEEIRGLQFRNAGSLLETTNLSIKEVALQSGYPNLKCLVRMFKKQMRDAPNELKINKERLVPTNAELADSVVA